MQLLHIKIKIKKDSLDNILKNKKLELENTINTYNNQFSKLNYLLEEKNMKNEIFEKVIPSYYVYYKEGILKDYSESKIGRLNVQIYNTERLDVIFSLFNF